MSEPMRAKEEIKFLRACLAGAAAEAVRTGEYRSANIAGAQLDIVRWVLGTADTATASFIDSVKVSVKIAEKAASN